MLTYTNPVRGRDQQGVVFAWMRDRRPELLATIWSIDVAGQPTRRTSHEVHSLAAIPLQVECPAVDEPGAKRAKSLSWELAPNRNRIQLPDDALPVLAKNRQRRLVQMRAIAKSMTAFVIDRNDDTERALRELPAPLLRYDGASKDSNIIDGAVFAFVLATDPELLLRIEATEDSWRIDPIRFTGTAIRLEHQGKQIWNCQKIDYRNQTGPYRLRVGVSELPVSPES